MKSLLVLLILAGVVGGVLFMTTRARATTPTPAYTVVTRDGAFEVRDYPALGLVSAPMAGGGDNGPFMHLFRFISGSNAAQEQVSMTTPVLMDRGTNTGTMSFILPEEVARRGAPAPTDPTVTLGQLPARRVACLRFTGTRSAESEQTALAQLEAWVAARKLTITGAPTFAYYDPPWTPGPLRRNEVMLPVAAP